MFLEIQQHYIEKGIVDADTDKEFELLVQSLRMVWDQREEPYNNPPQFHTWFVKHCKIEVKNTMLKAKRIAAGLGNPPAPFYTNDVESQTSVIKHQTHYRAQELPEFVATMQTMIDNQKQEIERAVAGVGEYQVIEQYKHLKIPTRKFCQMTQKQKEKHIKAFFSCHLSSESECGEEDDESIKARKTEDDATSVTSENPLYALKIPSGIADIIWSEAEELRRNSGNICLSPGSTNNQEWLVKSSEEKHRHPYFVDCKASGQILCEKNCALYMSCKVCAHTVAVAVHTHTTDRYMQWLQRQKGNVNLTALANTDMPKGAPHSHRKASLKSTTKRIKAIIEEADEDLTPRVQVSRQEPEHWQRL